MTKLLILLALLTLVLSVVLKKALTKSVNANGIQAQLNTLKLLEKVSPYPAEVALDKNITLKGGKLLIPKSISDSQLITDHASALMALGMCILSRGANTWNKRHQSMRLFDQAFLPFVLLITFFGILAKTIPANMAIMILAGGLILNCLNNFYICWVRKLAMKLALDRMKSVELYTKQEDAKATNSYLKSYPYKYLIPNGMKRLG